MRTVSRLEGGQEGGEDQLPGRHRELGAPNRGGSYKSGNVTLALISNHSGNKSIVTIIGEKHAHSYVELEEIMGKYS